MELFDQFVDVLGRVDQLLLLETYAAGETPIEGAAGTDLYQQLKLRTETPVSFVETIADVPAVLESMVQPGDLVMTQGAGETAILARNLTERWAERRVQ